MYTGMGEAKARPILSVDQNSGHVRVQCVARYLHCAQITGQFPDENLLHRLPLSNVHQQCRDDEMHMFRTGLMLHMFSGMCARYIRTPAPFRDRGGRGRNPVRGAGNEAHFPATGTAVAQGQFDRVRELVLCSRLFQFLCAWQSQAGGIPVGTDRC